MEKAFAAIESGSIAIGLRAVTKRLHVTVQLAGLKPMLETAVTPRLRQRWTWTQPLCAGLVGRELRPVRWAAVGAWMFVQLRGSRLDNRLASWLACFMRRISTYDAKNRLSELLDAVATGETIEIIRRGKPAARLTPIPSDDATFASAAEAARWLREHRTKVPRDAIRASIIEGRR